MKILITGSSGRVGRAIHARLAARHRVVGLDRRPSPTTDVVCDLLDAAAVRAAVVGVDAVIHTAALRARRVGQASDAELRRVNVEGTRLLAGQAIAVGVSRFVHASSTAVYGTVAAPPGSGPAAWIDEHTPPRPRKLGQETRLQAEHLLQSYGRAGALAVTILRLSRCFPEPAPTMAAYRLHRGVDVRDAAAALERAVETFNSGGVRLLVISGSTPFVPRDCEALGKDAAAVLRRRAPALAQAFEARGWALPRAIDRIYDASEARRVLDWQPRHGFEAVLDLLDAHSPDVLPPGPPERPRAPRAAAGAAPFSQDADP